MKTHKTKANHILGQKYKTELNDNLKSEETNFKMPLTI